MKSKFITKVSFKIKPCTPIVDEESSMPQFKVFVNDEMGMAKQMVINDK